MMKESSDGTTMPGAATREGPPPMGTVELDAASRNTVKTSSTRGGLVSRLFPANAQLFQNFQDSTQDPDATPQTQQATAAEASTKADEGIDHVLLAAKCTVPALFVLISGLVAIPLNQGILTEFARVASQEFAGGALIVTFAFELTKSYRIHDEEGELNKWLVICSFLGTLVSAQVQCAAQGMWPFAQRDRAEVTVGDSVPFAIGFFVDGVVLGYDAEAPPDPQTHAGLPCLQRWYKRIRPAFSVLTFVVSIDNGVDGVGMYQRLDLTAMPAWLYYAWFIGCIFAGGAFTALVRKIPSEGLNAAWFAFGALSILDGGMELAENGFTTWVMLGFLFVWGILLMG